MILTEWNTEDAIAFAREEGIDEGQNQIIELLEKGFSLEEIKLSLSHSTDKTIQESS